MADVSLPVGLLDTIIALVFTVVATLIGLVFRGMRGRVTDAEKRLEVAEVQLSDLEQQVSTLFGWAFGTDENEQDEGFAGDVQGKLSDLNRALEESDADEDERYQGLERRFSELVVRLEAEDALDFDSDDLE